MRKSEHEDRVESENKQSEHQTPLKRENKQSSASKITNTNSVTGQYLPIGLAYFESMRQQNLYQTITLPPPVNVNVPAVPFIASPQIKSSHNFHSRSFDESEPEAMDTNRNVQTERYVPFDMNHGPNERMLTIEHTPQMYKFTMEDAIKRENVDYRNLTAMYGPGPVTLAPDSDDDPLFDPRLIETNPQPEANEILEDIRQLTHTFPSGLVMSNNDINMNAMESPPLGPAYASPSTIATKLALPNFNHIKEEQHPASRGHVKFRWQSRNEPALDEIKYTDPINTNSSRIIDSSWEPMSNIPKDDPDVEITKEKIVELKPQEMEHIEMFAETAKKLTRQANVVEVSHPYSKKRSQTASVEVQDASIVQQNPSPSIENSVVYQNPVQPHPETSIMHQKPQQIPIPVFMNRPMDRFPKARITEYKAPSMYVPLRRFKPTERNTDDAFGSQAVRHERPVIAPRSEIAKYFQ